MTAASNSDARKHLAEWTAPEQPVTTGALTEDERDALWGIIASVRDAAPRTPDDADTDAIIDAIIDSGFFYRLAARAQPPAERAGGEAVDALARVLMAAWEKAEGKPVGASYVATFADMARAALSTGTAARDEAVVKAEALNAAADLLVSEYGDIWGGHASWLTTGHRVAALVADRLRALATDHDAFRAAALSEQPTYEGGEDA